MTDTPICAFVQRYAASDAVRLHMPGHKGKTFLGFEDRDITEIDGADTLYLPHGVIEESERNASCLFGCDTFYSAEGSSLCIRAMLYLAALHTGKRTVLAARNAHRVFWTAAALLDLDVSLLHPHPEDKYCACTVTADDLEAALRGKDVGAVYLTSPDYTGNVADVAALAAVCHRHGTLLLVDNAHGAYLHFLPTACHPIDLGADLCCDSAHKTLPVLTGGAYLHVCGALREQIVPHVKNALALFGSTSPSYLILQSLDNANRYLETYPVLLAAFLPKVSALRQTLRAHGYTLYGGEPLKITVCPKPFGYTGDALAEMLRTQNIYCEMHDPDLLTVMLTPENGDADLLRFSKALCAVPRKDAITEDAPSYHALRRVCSPREAVFAKRELLPVEQCVGRTLADYAVACPPAVPVVLCGEQIDDGAAAAMRYYGVEECAVLENNS